MTDVPMIPTEINGRWTLLLPQHRAERAQWNIENGGWETERIAAMAESIGPGSVVYDIGAEEGDLPALWASWGAEVVLVEPNPLVWPNMKVIFEANDLVGLLRGWFVGFAGEHARLPVGTFQEDYVWDEWGIWPKCAFGSVIGDHGFLVLEERPDVPVTTVDALAQEWGAPTHITIDVEGAELTVLRGARDVLLGQRPTVFVSIHTDLPWMELRYPGDTRDSVIAFMNLVGYDGEHLATDHEEHWVFRPRP